MYITHRMVPVIYRGLWSPGLFPSMCQSKRWYWMDVDLDEYIAVAIAVANNGYRSDGLDGKSALILKSVILLYSYLYKV